MIEIRWHARGGQGAVTASKILASSFIREGKHAQSAPDYGAERSGAPLRSYNRLSDEPILLHCQVVRPDIVVVVDPTLLRAVPFLEGTNESAIVLANFPEGPDVLRQKLDFGNRKIYTVDATQIAADELGQPNRMNIPMLGALIKVLQDAGNVSVDIETVKEDVIHTFEEKLSKELLEANLRALKRGYEEVKGQ